MLPSRVSRPVLVACLVMGVAFLSGCPDKHKNRGSGGPGGGLGSGPGVPPLPPDSFTPVDTLTGRNPALQTPFLPQPKDSMTATTLRNGFAIIIGGTSGGTAVSGAEFYDQRSAEFTPTGTMGQARRHHTATLTPAENIVVIGGVGAAGLPLVSTEVWNSATGQFQVAQQMREPRVGHTATSLPTGEILVAGGFTDGQSRRVTEVVEVLNLATLLWREHTPLQATNSTEGIPRALHEAVSVAGLDGIPGNGDDDILVMGGVIGDLTTKNITTITNSVLYFHPNRTTTPPGSPPLPGEWESVAVSGANSEPARMGAKAHVVSDGATHPVTGEQVTQVFVIGGVTSTLPTQLGPFSATTAGVSVVEDSRVANTSWYVLDLETASVGAGSPVADVSLLGCAGDATNCPPFVGGMGARSTYNAARGMLLYSGGNTFCTPPDTRCFYNRRAFVVEMIPDPVTGYRTPVALASAGLMGDIRSWHGSTLLPGADGIRGTADDTVLVVGGEESPSVEVSTADEYAFP